MTPLRSPAPEARRWFVVAAVAALVSLGLPWKNTVEVGFGFTYYGTGLCYNSYDYDGWMNTYCDPYWTPQLEVKPGITQAIGADHPVRVLFLLAALALFVGYRRSSTLLLELAPAIAALGIFGFGVTGMSGQLLGLLGLGALLMALYRDGLLRRPAVGDRPRRMADAARPRPMADADRSS